jgi:hypothetical protein
MYDEIRSDPLRKTDEGNILHIIPRYIKKYGFENYLKDSKLFSIFDFDNITSIISQEYDEDFYEECYSVHLLRQVWLVSRETIGLQKDSIDKRIKLKSVLDVNKIYSESTSYGYWQRKYL